MAELFESFLTVVVGVRTHLKSKIYNFHKPIKSTTHSKTFNIIREKNYICLSDHW